MTYRIYTEDTGRKNIEKALNRYFAGYTIYKAKGYWRCQPEKSLIIEIIDNAKISPQVIKAAQQIKKANKQQAVMVQKIKNNSFIV